MNILLAVLALLSSLTPAHGSASDCRTARQLIAQYSAVSRLSTNETKRFRWLTPEHQAFAMRHDIRNDTEARAWMRAKCAGR